MTCAQWHHMREKRGVLKQQGDTAAHLGNVARRGAGKASPAGDGVAAFH